MKIQYAMTNFHGRKPIPTMKYRYLVTDFHGKKALS